MLMNGKKEIMICIYICISNVVYTPTNSGISTTTTSLLSFTFPFLSSPSLVTPPPFFYPPNPPPTPPPKPTTPSPKPPPNSEYPPTPSTSPHSRLPFSRTAYSRPLASWPRSERRLLGARWRMRWCGCRMRGRGGRWLGMCRLCVGRW